MQGVHEAHKQAVKQAQKDRVHTFLAEIDQAMEDGDLRAAFKTLKLLRPWQPARRAQLKNPEGYLLSPAEELKALKQYAEGIFASQHPPLLPKTGPLPQRPVADLNKHIQSIKTGVPACSGMAALQLRSRGSSVALLVRSPCGGWSG